MRIRTLSLAAVLGLAGVAPAFAADPPAPASPGAAAQVGTSPAQIVPAAKEQLVCRKERPTGSHMAKRVCRTNAQAEAERAAARDELLRAKRPVLMD